MNTKQKGLKEYILEGYKFSTYREKFSEQL